MMNIFKKNPNKSIDKRIKKCNKTIERYEYIKSRIDDHIRYVCYKDGNYAISFMFLNECNEIPLDKEFTLKTLEQSKKVCDMVIEHQKKIIEYQNNQRVQDE